MSRKRVRDYKAEYKARLRRALDKGYSRSIARGHPKKHEIGLARAKALRITPGRIVRERTETRHGYRPTYAEIRARLRALGLQQSLKVLEGKRGRVPVSWVRPREGGKAYLIDDPTRDELVDDLMDQGLTEHEAYTLWFSP